METVYNLEKLVEYPIGAIVNLQCPEYKGVVSVLGCERFIVNNIVPCDLCALLHVQCTPCVEFCCPPERKDNQSVLFKPVKVRVVNTLEELATCKTDELVYVFTKCFTGHVLARLCVEVYNSCRDCAFNSPFTPCGPCCAFQREDGEEVYFEKI